MPTFSQFSLSYYQVITENAYGSSQLILSFKAFITIHSLLEQLSDSDSLTIIYFPSKIQHPTSHKEFIALRYLRTASAEHIQRLSGILMIDVVGE
jgi:hypothetical protein